MSLREPKAYITVDEYLASERDNAVRHEFVQGQVYAMAGASDRHNRIALNLASRFNDQLTDDGCETFMADMKVKVAEELYYYPDVVTCDPPSSDPYFRTQPRLIVEVLSPSTARIDRHEKLMAYRSLSSLQEYVMVMQDDVLVEIHRRQEDGQWKVEILSQPAEVVHFASVNISLTVADIYRNVRWESDHQ
ncbi:MAG: Uma2 family endonuclease [Blastocatellia bacterium]